MYPSLQANVIDTMGTPAARRMRAHRAAGDLFDRLRAQALLARPWARLTGRAHALRTAPAQPHARRQSADVVSVPLSQIVGSEGRADDFDAQFRPLNSHTRDRWIGLALAYRAGVTLPAVALVQDGDHYYVRDGHHRISVARAFGQMEIEAQVVNG